MPMPFARVGCPSASLRARWDSTKAQCSALFDFCADSLDVDQCEREPFIARKRRIIKEMKNERIKMRMRMGAVVGCILI